MESLHIDTNVVVGAMQALQVHAQNKEKLAASKRTKSQLFDDDDGRRVRQTVFLQMSFHRMPEKHNNKAYRAPLVHTLWTPDTEVCFLTKDDGKAARLVESGEMMGKYVHSLLPMKKLRTEFKDFEARRKLLAAWDVFVAEDSILPLLPPLLGSKFFQAHKEPRPVIVRNTADSLKGQLKKVRDSTYVYYGRAPSTEVKLALTTWNAEKVLENIHSVLGAMKTKIVGGLKGIHTLHLKTESSMALPIYTTDRRLTLEELGVSEEDIIEAETRAAQLEITKARRAAKGRSLPGVVGSATRKLKAKSKKKELAGVMKLGAPAIANDSTVKATKVKNTRMARLAAAEVKTGGLSTKKERALAKTEAALRAAINTADKHAAMKKNRKEAVTRRKAGAAKAKAAAAATENGAADDAAKKPTAAKKGVTSGRVTKSAVAKKVVKKVAKKVAKKA